MFWLLPRVYLRSAKCSALRRFSASPLGVGLDPGPNPSIILPEEQAPPGVRHMKRKRVPKNILRPYYVTGSKSTRPSGHASLIPLGGEDEAGIRAACKLARDALKLSESLVEVSLRFILQNQRPHSFLARCDNGVDR